MSTDKKMLYGIPNLANRWEVSKDTIRRKIQAGEIRSVRIGSRILVPLGEIERVEQFGVGQPRKDAGGAR
jgi:excisionase family DNA binding protein